MMFSLVMLCSQKQKNLSKTRFQNAVPILHASEKVAARAQCVSVFQKRGTRTFRVVVRVVGGRGRAYWKRQEDLKRVGSIR